MTPAPGNLFLVGDSKQAAYRFRRYDIDMAQFIANHLGVTLDLVRLDWKGILPGLQTGRFDVVFSNVNITPERKEMPLTSRAARLARSPAGWTARSRTGRGPSLMLNGLMDPGVEMSGWSVDFYGARFEDGWVWGLGT